MNWSPTSRSALRSPNSATPGSWKQTRSPNVVAEFVDDRVEVGGDQGDLSEPDHDCSPEEVDDGRESRAVLNHEDVPAVEHLQSRTRDPFGDQFGVRHRRDVVVAAGAHQCRLGRSRQFGDHVVAQPGQQLAARPANCRGRAAPWTRPPSGRSAPSPGIGSSASGSQRRSLRRIRVRERFVGRHRCQFVQRVRRRHSPRRGATQHQPVDDVGVADRKVERHHPTETGTEDMTTSPTPSSGSAPPRRRRSRPSCSRPRAWRSGPARVGRSAASRTLG